MARGQTRLGQLGRLSLFHEASLGNGHLWRSAGFDLAHRARRAMPNADAQHIPGPVDRIHPPVDTDDSLACLGIRPVKRPPGHSQRPLAFCQANRAMSACMYMRPSQPCAANQGRQFPTGTDRCRREHGLPAPLHPTPRLRVAPARIPEGFAATRHRQAGDYRQHKPCHKKQTFDEEIVWTAVCAVRSDACSEMANGRLRRRAPGVRHMEMVA